MKKNAHTKIATAALAVAALNGVAWAGVKEAAQSAATSASGVAVRVENATHRGVDAGTRGIRTGVGAANRGADKVARKLGLPTTKRTTPREDPAP